MSKNSSKPGHPPSASGDSSAGILGRPAHEKLVKGLSHPLRTKCLTILSDRTASPRELSKVLHHDLSNVSYHVRVLQELGLIELVGEESVRGAVAHYYKAVERPLVSAAEWEEMPLEVRKAMSENGLEVLFKDVTEAIEKGTFDDRPDRHLTRTPLLLDAEGFARLSGLMDELLEAIFSEQAAAAERMNHSREKPLHSVAATALFTMPEPGATQAQ
ncbi:MAG TPA: winged helix-turn-helix domain-containing protein [Solirubrobacterales bacterium]|nr:winged helix-turn-helix domain-containing protein [Solirubrobacterales bacterium]